MENVNTAAQGMEYIVTWSEIKARVSKLDKSLKYYGVPRGGQYIAAMLNPVDTPEEADIIIDDLIDSGDTFRRYEKYGKPFIGLFNKESENIKGWFVFPWEVNETPGADNFTRILQVLGEDVNREGLKETPKRYMKFLAEFLTPKPFKFTTFDAEKTDEMILVDHIPFHSLCEHHTLPFFGYAHVAYIPDKRIVGLSKIPRCVDFFANRLQNQERITTQIAEMIQEELKPLGVGVVLKAKHMCMEMRGVKKHDTWTTTSKLLGLFKTEDRTRNEFLNLCK